MLIKPLRSIVIAMLLCFSASAQDSTKAINHEIGFNTVLLVKQLISNNPNSTLAQLPYSVFYNLYFKDKIGIRLGLGLFNSKIKSTVEGQPAPRETTQSSTDLRLGFSYNFVKHNRITLNAFVDALHSGNKLMSVNTQTMLSFPGNTITITTTSTDQSLGFGAQVGVGLKYNLYKHLSIYAEIPLGIMAQTLTSEVQTDRTGQAGSKSSSKSTTTTTSIIVPTTLYLVLRF